MLSRNISIELGAKKVKVCEVDNHKRTPHVYKCIMFDTPMHLFEDGFIKDSDVLANLLKDKLEEAGFPKRRLVFTIASTRIAYKEVTIPMVKEIKIKDIVRANAEEYFPINVSDYTLSYSILERITGGEEKQIRLMVMAAPEAMIKNYYAVAKKLGYEVAGIDYMMNSTRQLARRKYRTGTNLILHMNEDITFFYILDNGNFSLPRTLPYGYLTILDTIIKSGCCKEGTEEEALQFLYRNNVFRTQTSANRSEMEDIHRKQNEVDTMEMQETDLDLMGEVSASLVNLMNNIARILEYYSRNQGIKLDHICLIGPIAKFMGIREVLSQEFGIEVKSMISLSYVVFHRKISMDLEDRIAYLSCIGAANAPVGFIPKNYEAQSLRSNKVHHVFFTLGAGTVLCMAIIGIAYFSYQSELIKNRTLMNEIERLSEVNLIYEENVKAKERLEEIKSIYALTVNPNERFIELFEELERRLPQKATVETLSANSTGITLSFRGDSEVTAALTLQQLGKLPFLSQVKTNSILLNKDENGVGSVQFVIEGLYDRNKILGDDTLYAEVTQGIENVVLYDYAEDAAIAE